MLKPSFTDPLKYLPGIQWGLPLKDHAVAREKLALQPGKCCVLICLLFDGFCYCAGDCELLTNWWPPSGPKEAESLLLAGAEKKLATHGCSLLGIVEMKIDTYIAYTVTGQWRGKFLDFACYGNRKVLQPYLNKAASYIRDSALSTARTLISESGYSTGGRAISKLRSFPWPDPGSFLLIFFHPFSACSIQYLPLLNSSAEAMDSSSTTLITFLVRTPPNTSFVKLLGSWDNFTRAYPMERDSRIGKGYWKGCHTFTNIICDGEINALPPGRDGGLRMGGTYWYYYLIDNEVEFFNEAEPVTTSCPLLPGQPLNVLNVPIHLPSTESFHTRDTNHVSQVIGHETMNPDDKYMNPRPPPRPTLPRLTTSPAMLMRSDYALTPTLSAGSSLSPAHGRSVSHPRAITSRRRFRIGGKLSLDLKISINPSTKPNSLRSSIMNVASPRFGRNNENRGRQPRDWAKYLIVKVPGVELNSNSYSSNSSPMWSPASNLNKLLPHPAGGYMSSEQSNQDNSLRESRGPSPSNTTLTFNNSSLHGLGPKETERPQWRPLDAYRDSISQQSTPRFIPRWESRGDTWAPDISSPLDLYEKRLPTLPNSPTSALDSELHSTGEEHLPISEEEYLQSHFSDFTAESPDDSCSPDSLQPGGSRFSEYSTDTDDASPFSMTSASTINSYGTFSPTTNEDKEIAFEVALANPPPQAISSQNSTQQCPSSTFNYCPEDVDKSSLYISKTPSEDDGSGRPTPNRDTNPRRKSTDKSPATPSWKHLILKHNNYSPNTNSSIMEDNFNNSNLPTPRPKPTNDQDHRMKNDKHAMTPCCGVRQGLQNPYFDSAMQELMNELGYLGDIIQDNAVKSY
ncbi:uncharacterized protein PADG_12168 [Paracoccidioides brasiliensis Pb18]|uniref:Uncharacterized protein n=1 Tax=Paracoccidioides brasiliensis (strain Pb18) TaxID=502780 RepID=A0A0A0HWG0_PARBD|nr:uncharacterized protein PADG_12168 [Paracoccidioides brasiliensis Pb18]KGM91710.1 hypothetical protein PADG_12168 [Paracoccidioides brasiliensis Pb18]